MTFTQKIETLKVLKAASDKAWRALMNDPKVLADTTTTHTPEIEQAWKNAADAECAFRVAHELQDYRFPRKGRR